MAVLQPQPAGSFNFKEVIYEKKGWVATVTFNRPQAYNAYSAESLQELTQAFLDASWDDSIAVVVLTGVGDKAFCTGGDVKEYEEKYTKRPRDYWKWMGLFVQCHDVLRNIGKPTIARINGMVVGGGNEFNLSCDLAVMAQHAYIRQVGTRVGSVAAGGATQWLPITIGDRRAREMLFLSEEIDASTALNWGLVNQVVPSVRNANGEWLDLRDFAAIKTALKDPHNRIDLTLLDEAVQKLADKLVDKFPECLRYTKQQINFWKDLAWSSTVGHARDWLSLHFASLEPYEGMTAFVEKRQPDYRGIRRKAAEGRSSEFLWGPYTHTCQVCGAKGIPAEFKYCGNCGAKLGEGHLADKGS